MSGRMLCHTDVPYCTMQRLQWPVREHELRDDIEFRGSDFDVVS